LKFPFMISFPFLFFFFYCVFVLHLLVILPSNYFPPSPCFQISPGPVRYGRRPSSYLRSRTKIIRTLCMQQGQLDWTLKKPWFLSERNFQDRHLSNELGFSNRASQNNPFLEYRAPINNKLGFLSRWDGIT